MDDAERLEGILDALERLRTLSSDHVILVEGSKDVDALRALDVDGDFFRVQSSGGPVKASEHVWSKGKSAIILTDWDRRGGILAEALRENLDSLGVPYDDTVRRDLAVLSRPYSKDVESMDSVVALLSARVDIEGRRCERRWQEPSWFWKGWTVPGSPPCAGGSPRP